MFYSKVAVPGLKRGKDGHFLFHLLPTLSLGPLSSDFSADGKVQLILRMLHVGCRKHKRMFIFSNLWGGGKQKSLKDKADQSFLLQMLMASRLPHKLKLTWVWLPSQSPEKRLLGSM